MVYSTLSVPAAISLSPFGERADISLSPYGG